MTLTALTVKNKAAVRQERRRARVREGSGIYRLELNTTLVLLLLESILGRDHGLDLDDRAVIETILAGWIEKSCVCVTRDAGDAELHDLLLDEIRHMGHRAPFVG